MSYTMRLSWKTVRISLFSSISEGKLSRVLFRLKIQFSVKIDVPLLLIPLRNMLYIVQDEASLGGKFVWVYFINPLKTEFLNEFI
jgi:hypothetical protein